MAAEGQDAGVPTLGPAAAADVDQALQNRIEGLREAARQWGMQPDTAEGAFASALIGVAAELGVLGQRMLNGHLQANREVRDTVAGWQSRGEKALDTLRDTVGRSGVLVQGMEEALRRFDQQVVPEMPNRIAAVIAPDLGRALRAPLEAKLLFQNRATDLRQWAVVAGTAVALLIGGFVAGLAAKPESLSEMQVDWCEQNPIMSGGKGYCELSHLRPMWRPTPAPAPAGS